jgi:NADPH:quinone reductase-like Zn-dependent oxidoreductase
MKAIVFTKYGSPDVLELKDIDKPVPGDNQILVKIYAASVNPLDWHRMRGKPLFMRLIIGGLIKPKHNQLGADIAGQVEAIGKDVTQFRVGDEVFGGCGWGGAFAEYVCVSEKQVALKPVNVTFEEAAAVPVAGITALQGLRDNGKLQLGQKVLINGASGGVGIYAIQIAKTMGAEVTAVCSTPNLELVRSLGADFVIDYTHEDCTKNGKQYDLIFDMAAYRWVSNYTRSLNPNGIYVMVGGSMFQGFSLVLLGPLISLFARKKMDGMMPGSIAKNIAALRELLVTGKIRSIIDRRYPLNEVADAVRYIEKGHARGKVIINIC